jgi:outer membrane protein assembly factor BamB
MAIRSVLGRVLAGTAAFGVVVAVGSAPAAAAVSGSSARAAGDGFNQPGNVLIADQFNNRVVEVDRSHHIVWQFGNCSSVAGPHSIVGTNDAERVGDLTLIAGTGTPPGVDPSCTNPAGCADNRVILVDREGNIVWQYGQAGVTGSGPNQLNTPVQATALPNGDVLITDQGNARVIEVTPDHRVVWQYGHTGLTGSGPNDLNNPNSAQLLPNGHVLIADENNNRVIEVTRGHDIAWQYGSPKGTQLSGAAFASRLPNGDTLITDSNNNRIVQVTEAKQVDFTFATNTKTGSLAMPLPTRAVRLANGDTIISNQFNDQVIEINPHGQIVFAQGHINVDGHGLNQLNAPYDAKVIGDYTGLTAPGDFR